MSNLEQIKKLREMTGAGLMAVKNALEQAGHDEVKAQELLRKSGAVKAQKKADRETNQGLVAVKISENRKKASIVQINCETDFVAKNENLINLVNELSTKNLETGQAESEFNSRKDDLILKIGENLTFGNADVIEAEYVAGYLHSNKKIGAILGFSQTVPEDPAHDIAMHISASNPEYLKPEDVPAAVIAKEKEIYREQLVREGKSESIIENIIAGKLNKFYEENCLINQVFIKDDKKHVGELLPPKVEITRFVRYSL